jgi:dipeptidyl aminopeptidase/acylaminoacyl peptidase
MYPGMRIATAVILLAFVGGCPARRDVQCTGNGDCSLHDSGLCLSVAGTGHKWCAYPDSGCQGSGYRYSNVDVGDGLSNSCVSPVDAGVDAGIDGSVTDGDTACRLRVAFSDGAPKREVWISNVDGTGMINLSSNVDADDAHPVWSPSGQKVAFASNRRGKYDIWVINIDGTGLTNLTADSAYDSDFPVYSPDGLRIAFTRSGSVWVMNANGTGAAAVASRAQEGVAAWSPNGTKLVISSANPNVPVLFVVTVGDGSQPVMLNSGRPLELDPTWSPHPQIVFTDDSDIFAINADGTNLTNITKNGTSFNGAARVTRDGTRVFFASNRGAPGTNLQIWTIPYAGGASAQVTTNTIAGGRDITQDVSADGALVLYAHLTSATARSVGVIHSDGSGAVSFNASGQSNADGMSFSVCP